MKSPGKDILVAAAVCGCSLLLLGQELVPVHGHQLFLSCEGPSAGPTVILMAGGGGTMKIWGKVQPQVATFARVCSYDRAGLGESSAIKEPQSAAEIADDLAAFLETATVPTPYILVGHSIGGLYVRKYDKREDSKVSAMVLIDMAFCEGHARGHIRVPAVEKHEDNERPGFPPS